MSDNRAFTTQAGAVDVPDQDNEQEVWRAFRLMFCNDASRLVSLAEGFKKASRQADATQVLECAIKLFPNDPRPALGYAQLAIDEQAWSEACSRYQRIREVFPSETIGYLFGGWALWKAERYSEADAILGQGMVQHPENVWFFIHYAWSAQGQKNWAEAARRFAVIRERFPDNPTGYIEGGWCLREAGNPVDADPILKMAVEKFPEAPMAWFHYGRNASCLGNRAEAVSRWLSCKAQLPDDPVWHRELRQAIYEADFENGPASGGSAITTSPFQSRRDPTIGMSDEDLLGLFESIGDNCEFGLVQRHFGAEPLGLLRFAGVPTLEHLLSGLANKFEGVGDENNVKGETFYDGEYLIRSNVVFNLMHTHVYNTSGTPLSDVVKSMRPRLKYLVRRMNQTLADGSKILIYKQYEQLTDEEIRKLHRALRRLGPNKLVCIRRIDGRHEEGQVDLLERDVAVAYLDFLKETSVVDLPHWNSWLKICREAANLLR